MTPEAQSELLIRLDERTERMENDIADVKQSVSLKLGEKEITGMIQNAIHGHIVDCVNQRKNKPSVSPTKKEFWTPVKIEMAKFLGMVVAAAILAITGSKVI